MLSELKVEVIELKAVKKAEPKPPSTVSKRKQSSTGERFTLKFPTSAEAAASHKKARNIRRHGREQFIRILRRVETEE
ncbi:hypothetical protein M436DRAFT_78044 [Aureobasidium namibiae CBS 147.97]|uniref:Uncharacterized protein n=1 Tax=Aureobasidium namibiae CBS 147.97 TaxID=1043004 RepID=A0A074WYG2_9PEZI